MLVTLSGTSSFSGGTGGESLLIEPVSASRFRCTRILQSVPSISKLDPTDDKFWSIEFVGRVL